VGQSCDADDSVGFHVCVAERGQSSNVARSPTVGSLFTFKIRAYDRLFNLRHEGGDTFECTCSTRSVSPAQSALFAGTSPVGPDTLTKVEPWHSRTNSA